MLIGLSTGLALAAEPVVAAPDAQVVARRGYFTGTTDKVRDAVERQAAPHGVTLSTNKQVAEFGAPPPACGVSVHAVFARYCTSQLKIALVPCEISSNYVRCSTAYLEPQGRTFWRLRYRHAGSEVSVDLEALRRDPSGRLESEVPRLMNEFEELFDLLLRAIRCDAASR